MWGRPTPPYIVGAASVSLEDLQGQGLGYKDML